jgi:hypothetical protein
MHEACRSVLPAGLHGPAWLHGIGFKRTVTWIKYDQRWRTLTVLVRRYPMRKISLLCLTTLALLMAGCTWGIKLNDAGRKVRTAWIRDVSQCKQLGKITVSVMNRVGPIDRNDIKVRDELEVMARNEAATMGADTVKPLGEPSNGEQTWGAYQCGSSQPASAATAASSAINQAAPTGTAKTYPVKAGGV